MLKGEHLIKTSAAKLQYRIEGMDCAEEVALLKRELVPLVGEESLGFDLLNSKLTVDTGANSVSPSQIAAAIARSGLTAVPWSKIAPVANESFWSQHKRTLLTATSGLAGLVGFLIEWLSMDASSTLSTFLVRAFYAVGIITGCVIVKPTADEVASAVCEWLIEAIENAIQERGKCSIALSGGSTPKLLYEKIAENELHCVDWSKVALLWGDERNVSQDHEDSNYGMVKRAWLERAEATRQPRAIPQVYPVPVQTNAPDRTAHEYSETIRKVLGENNDSAGSSSSASTLSTSDRMAKSDLPKIDIVLLGLGDDAHTASLFPETQALQESENLFVANFVPKFEAYRLTMTLPLINAADKVAFLVCGPSKRAAIDVVWHGPRQVEKYPAQGIHPANGELLWFLDVAAMPERRQG